jgi:ribosomal protein S18 acetylase RimI-like enzyme
MSVLIHAMSIADYNEVIGLLTSTPGVSLRSADSREAVERYLDRNPGLSFVARVDGLIIGCIMSGHDGRRGYLQHLAVEPSMRRQGIGTALVQRCLDALRELGIEKSHVEVLAGNEVAHRYWTTLGWQKRADIVRYSIVSSTDPNA